VGLIVAAGWLHDIARDQPDHAAKGAELLADLGYPRIADIVRFHMDLPERRAPLSEADLLYLADKCVAEDRLVLPAERFRKAAARFSGNSEAAEGVRRRLRVAEALRERVEAAAGVSIEAILETLRKSIRFTAVSKEKDIYIVRHGAIQLPSGEKRFVGQSDFPLSEEGIRQARDLKDVLSRVKLSAVYCSDLVRSVETARIISEPHGIEPIEMRELREIFLGRWENLTFQDVATRYPEEFEERGNDIVNYRPPEGESFMDCANRVIPAFFNLLHGTEENILIAGHAGVNRIILCQAMGLSMGRLLEIEQSYGCLNAIHFCNPGFEVRVVNGKTSMDLKLEHDFQGCGAKGGSRGGCH
jgi:probable phosphoglycerate mutase